MADTVIFPEQTLTLTVDGGVGSLVFSPAPFVLVVGETYRVVFDGVEYELICTLADGVPTLECAVLDENGEPTRAFRIGYGTPEIMGTESDAIGIMYIGSEASHTLAIYHVAAEDPDYLVKASTLTAIANAIRAKTGKGDAIAVPNMAAEIEGITASGGGGSSADVRYVTFMSYDGTMEYGRKAVATGDDCADPIARGLFDTPTRESTVQYDYTFCGWATTVNGAADSNWYEAVTEDKVVYASFAAAVRRYTITYYDGDTVLKTESVAYGVTPVYVPEKSGYSFVGWEPALTAVTGDASYYAQFSEKLSFAGASWADIAAISAAGEAASNFAVGDTKEVPITYADGTTGTITVAIAGFGIDDKADGSGKAGITIVTKTIPNYKTAWNNSSSSITCTYNDSLVRAALQKNGAIWNMLPTALTSVIKNVNKKCDTSVSNGESPSLLTLTDPLWALSTYEFGQTTSASTTAMSPGGGFVSILGSRYPFYPVIDMSGYSGTKTDFPYVSTGAAMGSSWTRSLYRLGVSAVCIISSNEYAGAYNGYAQQDAITKERYVCFGFCI